MRAASGPVVVVGGGVAGCAAALAAAQQGARTVLVEARWHLGGVAVAGEHRTLCGLSPIDAAAPELLEPDLTKEWVSALAIGPAVRQGRVWLWPTAPGPLQQGLARRLAAAGVEVLLGAQARLVDAAPAGAPAAAAAKTGPAPGPGQEVRIGISLPGAVVAERIEHARAVIDASGQALVARQLGLPLAAGEQWAACRGTALFPGSEGGSLATRLRLIAALQRSVGGTAGIALHALGEGRWQVGIDVPPSSAPDLAHAHLERAVDAAGGTLESVVIALAERDGGRPLGELTCPELFATRERGWCWAAWPREEHRAEGVLWSWPPFDRHGIPARAVRSAGMPDWAYCIGKGMPVSLAAASALRVTGTCLALGAAVGAHAGVSASQG